MIRTMTLFLAATAFASPALAQSRTPMPSPAATGSAATTGATVYDTSGAVVGTIASTDGTNAVLDTGSVKAAIPLSSFGKGAKGPVIAMTKAQLEAQVGAATAQADAAFKAKLVPGAAVYGAGGTQIGTIKTATADSITITTPNGDAVLPAAGFGPGPSGVTIGLSADQLAAQMGGAASGATTTTTAADTATPATGDGAAAETTTTSTTTATTAAPTTPPKTTTTKSTTTVTKKK